VAAGDGYNAGIRFRKLLWAGFAAGFACIFFQKG
jgi:hypothetical protein